MPDISDQPKAPARMVLLEVVKDVTGWLIIAALTTLAVFAFEMLAKAA